MTKDSPIRALLTVLVTAVVCSFFVSGSVVLLRPIQLNNKLLERSGNVLALTGQLPAGGEIGDEALLDLFKSLDARVVDIDEAELGSEFDPYTFDGRKAAADPELSVVVPSAEDIASLGRRSSYKTIYLVWKDGKVDRVILPIRGAGMWSMIYGYISLESDFSTIAGVKFYDALKMIKRLVNIGDAKTLSCHPASTTHRQLTPEEQQRAGVTPEMIRLCIGIEHIDDIIADIAQAFDAV